MALHGRGGSARVSRGRRLVRCRPYASMPQKRTGCIHIDCFEHNHSRNDVKGGIGKRPRSTDSVEYPIRQTAPYGCQLVHVIPPTEARCTAHSLSKLLAELTARTGRGVDNRKGAGSSLGSGGGGSPRSLHSPSESLQNDRGPLAGFRKSKRLVIIHTHARLVSGGSTKRSVPIRSQRHNDWRLPRSRWRISTTAATSLARLTSTFPRPKTPVNGFLTIVRLRCDEPERVRLPLLWTTAVHQRTSGLTLEED